MLIKILKLNLQLLLLIFFSSLFCSIALALSPLAGQGEKDFPACGVCHNFNLNPPRAAPTFAIQHSYMRAYGSRQSHL